jgi:hypothetical protein
MVGSGERPGTMPRSEATRRRRRTGRKLGAERGAGRRSAPIVDTLPGSFDPRPLCCSPPTHVPLSSFTGRIANLPGPRRSIRPTTGRPQSYRPAWVDAGRPCAGWRNRCSKNDGAEGRDVVSGGACANSCANTSRLVEMAGARMGRHGRGVPAWWPGVLGESSG